MLLLLRNLPELGSTSPPPTFPSELSHGIVVIVIELNFCGTLGWLDGDFMVPLKMDY
jgi:hypothetical protein